ncbi:uncharacterized protein LOC134067905 [Sardina pilchardus]|uniref:uncharacterized protein LOC134067905 n=1 Tax=Sardina pilchardus TaxID=27697 RepID=UPI002E0D92A9
MRTCLVGDTLVNFRMSLTPGQLTQRSMGDMSEQEVKESDLREIERNFTELEKRCEHLGCLLEDQEVWHGMDLRAVEREREQERAERERQMRERDEDLLASLMTVAISRERVMSELRKRQAMGGAMRSLRARSLPQRLRRWFSSSLSCMNVRDQGSPRVNPRTCSGERTAGSAGFSMHRNNAPRISEESVRGFQGVLRSLKRIAKLEKKVQK